MPVAEEMHIRRAAARLGDSQPSLTRRIRRLEHDRLTAAGEISWRASSLILLRRAHALVLDDQAGAPVQHVAPAPLLLKSLRPASGRL